jgi:hypothetical protein
VVFGTASIDGRLEARGAAGQAPGAAANGQSGALGGAGGSASNPTGGLSAPSGGGAGGGPGQPGATGTTLKGGGGGGGGGVGIGTRGGVGGPGGRGGDGGPGGDGAGGMIRIEATQLIGSGVFNVSSPSSTPGTLEDGAIDLVAVVDVNFTPSYQGDRNLRTTVAPTSILTGGLFPAYGQIPRIPRDMLAGPDSYGVYSGGFLDFTFQPAFLLNNAGPYDRFVVRAFENESSLLSFPTSLNGYRAFALLNTTFLADRPTVTFYGQTTSTVLASVALDSINSGPLLLPAFDGVPDVLFFGFPRGRVFVAFIPNDVAFVEISAEITGQPLSRIYSVSTLLSGNQVLSSPIPPLDLNIDGSIDENDILDLTVAIDAGAPLADFNNDGSGNFFDLLDYLAAYDAR